LCDKHQKSMKVTVKFTPYFRAQTRTEQTVVHLNEGAQVNDLLRVLTAQYGEGLRDLVYAANQDSIDVWASVIIDGKALPLPLAPESNIKLKEGSVVILLAPVAGG